MSSQTNLEKQSARKNRRLAGRMTPCAVAESSTFLTGKTRGAKVGARILSLLLCLSRQPGQPSQAARH
jgi:hypothetical protein